jgi:hypothetical protein
MFCVGREQKAARRVIALWHKNKVNNKSLSPFVVAVDFSFVVL